MGGGSLSGDGQVSDVYKRQERLLSFILEEDDLVLDFFSGSATLAEAVMKLHNMDNRNRRYICAVSYTHLDVYKRQSLYIY